MNRAEFLDKHWLTFPSALDTWSDVSAAINSTDLTGPRFVCGRLARVGNQTGLYWELSSNGVKLSFYFSADATWMEPVKKSVLFLESILEVGDLVCLSLDRRGDAWFADQALLLVPTKGVFVPKSRFSTLRAHQWAEFLRAVREFFYNRGFTDAYTPTLVPSPGTEPYLDPFQTAWEMGSTTINFYLPTSPEFHLKKMLTLGWTKLFEIKLCFRNGEVGEHHQPEFHMLEWYRAYANLDAIVRDVEDLLLYLGAPRLKVTTMTDLFSTAFAGFELTPETSRDDLAKLASAFSITVGADDTFDDLFFRLFLEKIEAGLGADGPLIVRGYPPSQAALSRIGPDGFADRFELYWRGLEIANAFHELNDPVENEKRFEEDRKRKAEIGKPPVPRDEDLVRALNYGLPPSGGIALGLERLFMALNEIAMISETRAFPLAHN